jgi:hypothetical protein
MHDVGSSWRCLNCIQAQKCVCGVASGCLNYVQEYQGRVAAEERRLATSGEDYTDEDMNLARLDAGLYTLQQVRAFRYSAWLCMQNLRSGGVHSCANDPQAPCACKP